MLSVGHGVVPANLHFTGLPKELQAVQTGLFVPQRTTDWPVAGAEPRRAAHVGDTPRTDIAGAQAVGMTSIRCAATADHPEPPEADFVIRDHRDIPGILERLE